jgi:hypothetical protein
MIVKCPNFERGDGKTQLSLLFPIQVGSVSCICSLIATNDALSVFPCGGHMRGYSESMFSTRTGHFASDAAANAHLRNFHLA